MPSIHAHSTRRIYPAVFWTLFSRSFILHCHGQCTIPCTIDCTRYTTPRFCWTLLGLFNVPVALFIVPYHRGLFVVFGHRFNPSQYTTLSIRLSSTVMSDPTTQSNYEAIATTDVELDWRVDFDTQSIEGSVVHRLKVLSEDGVDKVMYVVPDWRWCGCASILCCRFDTLDLEVERVEVRVEEAASWEGVQVGSRLSCDGSCAHCVVRRRQFVLGDAHPVMGSALIIPLGRVVHPAHADVGVRVRVTYRTRESKALQWLGPQYVRAMPSRLVPSMGAVVAGAGADSEPVVADRRRANDTRICLASVSRYMRAHWSHSKVRTLAGVVVMLTWWLCARYPFCKDGTCHARW